MNVWKVRHEGSSKTSPDLTFEQVMQGLLDARFSPEDEVKGPADAEWRKLEEHPAFEEAAADIEPPPPREYDDETRLDFNALIDVSLVLLIFFILTTTYTNLQKIIEAAEASSNQPGKVKVIRKEAVDDTMVHVKVEQKGDETSVFVEKSEVKLANIEDELRSARQAAKKVILLLEHDYKVPHGVIVTIQDAAKTAGLEKVYLLVP